MVRELGGDDVGQQPRAAQPLGDRPDLRRAGGPQPLLGGNRRRVTRRAGVALADRAQDEQPGRLQVELLGGLRADAHARPAAARAALLRVGQVVDHLAPLAVLGQHAAAVLVAPRCGLGCGGNRGRALPFGAAAEAVLERLVELGLQRRVVGA